jgi:hypothetical protein
MAAAAGMNNLSADPPSTTGFAGALLAAGPSAELGEQAKLYGWLIGRWKVRVVDHEGGRREESSGEWLFSWVLEGRAIQDVFIVPARPQRTPTSGKERNRYGVSLRWFDPKLGAWRITWTNPVRAVQNQLIGRKVGGEILQEARDAQGRLVMRWCFRDITANSFRWTGESSADDGKTWQLGAEFFATRVGGE